MKTKTDLVADKRWELAQVRARIQEITEELERPRKLMDERDRLRGCQIQLETEIAEPVYIFEPQREEGMIGKVLVRRRDGRFEKVDERVSHGSPYQGEAGETIYKPYGGTGRRFGPNRYRLTADEAKELEAAGYTVAMLRKHPWRDPEPQGLIRA